MRLPAKRTTTPHPTLAHTVRRLVPALLFAGVCAAPASAHQYWLAPSRYDAPAGEIVTLRVFAGTGFRGEWKPWSPIRSVRFVARTDRIIDLTRGASLGSDQWARFATKDDHGVMLAYESTFVPITLPSREFDEYLHEEGLTAAAEARRKSVARDSVRERYRRCAKSWLAGDEVARATKPMGQPLEVVPLSLPGSEPTLRVRVLSEGKPLAGALVRTWRAPLDRGVPSDAADRDSVGVALEARTDPRGEVTVRCEVAGEWLVSVVDMRPSRDKGAAEWESTWASLTFVRREKAPAAK